MAGFTGIQQGQGRALRGPPGLLSQEINERTHAEHIPLFEARADLRRCLPYQETLPQSWHLCHTGRLQNAYLETRMCNVSLEIYTFSVKDTSAVRDRHV